MKYEAITYEGCPEINLTLYMRKGKRGRNGCAQKRRSQNVAIDMEDIYLKSSMKEAIEPEDREEGRDNDGQKERLPRRKASSLKRSTDVLRARDHTSSNHMSLLEISKSGSDRVSLIGWGDFVENQDDTKSAPEHLLGENGDSDIQWLEMGSLEKAGNGGDGEKSKVKVVLKIDDEQDFPSLSESIKLRKARPNGSNGALKRRDDDIKMRISTETAIVAD